MFISKRKNGYYYLHYNNSAGKRISISTKQKIKSEALRFLTTFKMDEPKRNLEKTNFDSVKWQYLKHSESIHSFKTTLAYRQILKQFSDYFSNPNLQSLTQYMIEIYLQEKLNVSTYTAQKHLAYLRSFFNNAVDKGLIKDNPCRKIKNFKLPQKLPVYFSDNEFKKLLEAVDSEDLKDLIIFAVNTGLRQMELLTLCWNQINFKDKIIILNNQTHITKSKKVRSIPLNNTTFNILLNRSKRAESCLIFTYKGLPIKQDFITHKFKKYVRKAKLDDRLHFHSLRHSFASKLTRKGVGIYQVSKLLGHADIKTTMIYAHLRVKDLRESVELLDH